VPVARRLLRGLLAGSPRVDDLEVIASELMTNAIRHTPSGHAGGTFTITIRSAPGLARIEVRDHGTGRRQPGSCDTFAEYGRGLLLVAALADGLGSDVDLGSDALVGQAHIMWAEVTW